MATSTTRTAFDDFADKLHRLPEAFPKTNPDDPKEAPRYKDRDPAYYADLAADIPKLLEAAGYPPDTAELSPEQAADFLYKITSRLDPNAGLGPDGKPLTMDTRQSFSIAFHEANTADGNPENPLKISELQEKLQEENFRRNIQSAQRGLLNRTPDPGMQAWTLEKFMGLIQALLSGDLSKLQNFLQEAALPASGEKGLSQDTEALDQVDLQDQTLGNVAALTLEVREKIMERINPRDDMGQRTTQGPISQMTYEGLRDEGAKAFFKDQPRLETLLSEELNSPDFAARAAELGFAPEQLAALKGSINNTLLADEQNGRLEIDKDYKGDPLYVTYTGNRHLRDTAATAAREFALRMDDPSLLLPPGMEIIERHLKGEAASAYQLPHRIPGDFAWRMTEAAGFSTGELTYNQLFTRQVNSFGEHPTEIERVNLEGMPPAAREFFVEVHDIAAQRMIELRQLSEGEMPGRARITAEDMKGFIERHQTNPDFKNDVRLMKDILARGEDDIPAQSLLEQMVARELADRYRARPEILQRLGVRQADLERHLDPLSRFPKADHAALDDRNFDLGAPIAAGKNQVDFSKGESVTITGDNGSLLYLKTGDNDLKVFTPKVTPQGGGRPDIVSFDPAPMNGRDIRKAIEEVMASPGGKIETRMLAEQDGLADGKAMPIGVQLVLHKEGKIVGNAVIGFDSIEMENSRAFLSALKQNLDQKGLDDKGPRAEYALDGLDTPMRQQAQQTGIIPGYS